MQKDLEQLEMKVKKYIHDLQQCNRVFSREFKLLIIDIQLPSSWVTSMESTKILNGNTHNKLNGNTHNQKTYLRNKALMEIIPQNNQKILIQKVRETLKEIEKISIPYSAYANLGIEHGVRRNLTRIIFKSQEDLVRTKLQELAESLKQCYEEQVINQIESIKNDLAQTGRLNKETEKKIDRLKTKNTILRPRFGELLLPLGENTLEAILRTQEDIDEEMDENNKELLRVLQQVEFSLISTIKEEIDNLRRLAKNKRLMIKTIKMVMERMVNKNETIRKTLEVICKQNKGNEYEDSQLVKRLKEIMEGTNEVIKLIGDIKDNNDIESREKAENTKETLAKSAEAWNKIYKDNYGWLENEEEEEENNTTEENINKMNLMEKTNILLNTSKKLKDFYEKQRLHPKKKQDLLIEIIETKDKIKEILEELEVESVDFQEIESFIKTAGVFNNPLKTIKSGQKHSEERKSEKEEAIQFVEKCDKLLEALKKETEEEFNGNDSDYENTTNEEWREEVEDENKEVYVEGENGWDKGGNEWNKVEAVDNEENNEESKEEDKDENDWLEKLSDLERKMRDYWN